MAEMDSLEFTMDRNPLKITDPEKIPGKRYYDEEFYKLECEHVWPKVWQMACRLEQIPHVGDWVEYSNVGQSVIVIRTGDGVKAFQNHCRHRGVKLAGREGKAHGNCARMGFVCPFHGWRWNMDGENTFVYGRHKFSEDLLNRDDLALRTVRCETWGGCAFINFDPDALDLHASLGPILESLDAHNMDKVRVQWWCATELPANWKVAMEAFMEGYHVMATHPQMQHAAPEFHAARYGDTGGLGRPVDPGKSVAEHISGTIEYLDHVSVGMGGGMCQEKEMAVARTLTDALLPDAPEQAVPAWYDLVKDRITQTLRKAGESVPDLKAADASDPVSTVEFLFPHYFVLRVFSSYSSYRIRPLGPEKCLFEIWALTHFPEGEEPEPPTEPTVLPYDSDEFPLIPKQDYSNIPLQQLGLHSAGFEFMRLSKEHEGMISGYQRVIDGYIEGAGKAELARATHALASNFDGPVLDLDL